MIKVMTDDRSTTDKTSGTKILISSCLLGMPVRYDGKANDSKVSHALSIIRQWQSQGILIPVCPEISGGLPTPRRPAEIQHGNGADVLQGKSAVITTDQQDVSKAFIAGARNTLKVAQQHNAGAALLAARSPSCGSDGIYDGSFSRTLIDGQGVTVALLEQHGIRCFSPDNIHQLEQCLKDKQ